MEPLSLLLSLNPIDWVLKPILEIQQTVNLLIFGFKIVVLLFIVQFVRGRFGGGPMVTILILVLGYILLDYMWFVFGPAMFVYLLIAFGFMGLLFDLVIAKPWASGGGEEEAGHMTYKEYSHMAGQRKAMQRRVLGR